jgi:hypothetical protein
MELLAVAGLGLLIPATLLITGPIGWVCAGVSLVNFVLSLGIFVAPLCT